MGVVTMVRMTRNMPKKLTDATLYSSSMHGVDEMIKSRPHVYESPEAAISRADYLIMMKRMNELEEKMSIIYQKPPTMAPEKEEMLNNALSRVDALEQELSEAKKVLFFLSLLHANYLSYKSILEKRIIGFVLLKILGLFNLLMSESYCRRTGSRASSLSARGASRLHREKEEEEEVLCFLTTKTIMIVKMFSVSILVEMVFL